MKTNAIVVRATPTTPLPLMTKADARALSSLHRRRCIELLALIHRKMQEVTDAFFDIGEALAEISNNRLYVSMGSSSFAEFLERHELISQPQANKLILVAMRVPREHAVELGAEKAYALTRYAQAASADGHLEELIRPDAIIDGQAVSALSVRDIRQATQRVASKGLPHRNRTPAHPLVVQARALLRRHGLHNVKVRGGRRGTQPTVHIELSEAALQKLNAGL